MKHAALLLSIVCLSGCETAARIDPPVIASYPKSPGCNQTPIENAIKPGAIDLDCFKFPEANGNFVGETERSVLVGRLTGGTVTKPVIVNGVVTMTISDASVVADAPAYDLAVRGIDYRNRLAAILLNQSDYICEKDQASITANQAALDGFLSILTTGLATAGSLVTGERANSLLAGSAAFVSGSRKDINSTVYRDKLAPAITAASAAERTRLRELIDRRRLEPVTSFSVDDMIGAANQYHQACSFYKGIELALTTSTKYAAVAAFAAREQALNNIKDLTEQLKTAENERKTAADMSESIKLAADANYQYILQQIGRERIAAFGAPGVPGATRPLGNTKP